MYVLGCGFRPKQYDSEQSNDTTYTTLMLNPSESMAYDRGLNDVATITGLPGAGLGFGDTGSIALRFDLAASDTVRGVDLWLDSSSEAGDSIEIALRRSMGGLPADALPGAMLHARRNSSIGSFTRYEFVAPVLVDTGSVWASVTQLGKHSLNLGADGSLASLVQTAMDTADPSLDRFVLPDKEMAGRVAVKQASDTAWRLTFDSTTGHRFIFAVDSLAPGFAPAFASSTECGKGYNVFGAQRIWMPMIRLVFTSGAVEVRDAGSERASSLELMAYPTPFTSSVQIFGSGEKRIVIHDALGRVVKTIASGKGATWYGFDEHGMPVQPGVYFVRCGVATQRVVLVR
jgi:hypothetical protein